MGDRLYFTYYAIPGGIILNIVLLSLFSEPYREILAETFSLVKFAPEMEAPMSNQNLLGGLLAAGIGCVLLYLSSRLDFIDSKDDDGPSLATMTAILPALCGLAVYINTLRVASLEAEFGLGSFLGVIVFSLLGLVSIPFFLIFGFVCTSVLMAGLICVPRICIYLTTTHALRRPWKEGERDGAFPAPQVVSALGQPSTSKVHARALWKDLRQLVAEVSEKLVHIRRVRDELAKEIEDDTKRLQLEAELAAKMAEYEDLKMEVKAMTEFQKGSRP